jgi:O-antigen ligase
MFRPLLNQADHPARSSGAQRGLTFALITAVVAVLIVIPMPFSVGALLAPVALLALLVNPTLLILGLVVSVPIQDAVPVPEGVPITITRVMTAVAFLLTPIIMIRRGEPARWTWFIIPFLVLIGAMLISLLNARDPGASFGEVYHWIVAIFALWLSLQFLQSRKQIVAGVAIIAFLAIAQGGLGLGQALTGAGPPSFQVGAGFSRAFGTFGMPNSFAAYMEMIALPLIPLAIWAGAQALERFREYRRVRPRGYLASQAERTAAIVSMSLFGLIGLGMVVGLAAIAVSFSRGGWVGTIVALIVIVALLGRRAVFTAAATTLVLSFGLILGASGAILTVIEERFTQLVDQVSIGDVRGLPVTDDNFAAIERMSHWQTAIAMWDQHPWIGVGSGNFNERFTEFAVHPQFSESQGHAHNYYLHLLAETGIVGLFAYIVLLLSVFFIGWKAYRSPDSLARAIGIGVLGTASALVIHNIFENLHVLNITVQMAFLWALAIIATRIAQPHTDPETEHGA